MPSSAKQFFAVCAREISPACEAIRRVVTGRMVCTGEYGKSRGACGAHTAEVWIQSASPHESAKNGAEGTTETGLG